MHPVRAGWDVFHVQAAIFKDPNHPVFDTAGAEPENVAIS